MYEPEVNEMVKVTRLQGNFRFVRFERDAGGDYAVVVGGLSGHRLERCVTVDRVKPKHRRRRTIKTTANAGT